MTQVKGNFKAGHFLLPLGTKTYTVGILNITPDSFSDGGRYVSLPEAITKANQMVASGVDILDIGGESTRPGSQQVSATDEMNRVVPVVEALAATCQVPLSVDTFKASVADAALSAGASLVNDVTGLFGDPAMAEVVARHHAGLILMHNAVLYRSGHPAARSFTNMPLLEESVAAQFAGLDLPDAVRLFFEWSVSRAMDAGIEPQRIILDPGIGFGLTTEESLELLASLDKLQGPDALHLPLLVGPSRKRFIGDLLGKPVHERLNGTLAAVAASIARGADFVRVHDVEEVAQAVIVSDAILRR